MEGVSYLSTDVLVIGSGGAGMRAAIAASDLGVKVTIISKGRFGCSGSTVTSSADVNVDSNSIGKIFGLPCDPEDSKDKYFEDTVTGGRFLNNQSLVEILVDEAPERVKELVDWGAEVKHVFLTPGHRYRRGLMIEGRKFALTLVKEVKRRPIEIIENCLALDIAKDDQKVTGVYSLDLNTGSFLTIKAKAVVVATGGAMNVFPLTTAPNDLMGDGIAMAYRAGAEILDMEFPMFILGCCYPPALAGNNYPFVLLCRSGAQLFNREGERYMEKWDPLRKERTTRDLLAIGTSLEILEGRGGPHGGVWTSLKHLPNDLIDCFSEWYLDGHGYKNFDVKDFLPDLHMNGIESMPSAHFWNGGIKIGVEGETCVPGLFAAGEVTGGVHGANRISGNAMTEILVWGFRAGNGAARSVQRLPLRDCLREEEKNTYSSIAQFLTAPPGNTKSKHISNDVIELKKELQQMAGECIGPIREPGRLEKALSLVAQVTAAMPNVRCKNTSRIYNREWIDAINLRNICEIIKLTTLSALEREESRGGHYRKDYPQANPNWIKNIIIKNTGLENPDVFHRPIVSTRIKPTEV